MDIKTNFTIFIASEGLLILCLIFLMVCFLGLKSRWHLRYPLFSMSLICSIACLLHIVGLYCPLYFSPENVIIPKITCLTISSINIVLAKHSIKMLFHKGGHSKTKVVTEIAVILLLFSSMIVLQSFCNEVSVHLFLMLFCFAYFGLLCVVTIDHFKQSIPRFSVRNMFFCMVASGFIQMICILFDTEAAHTVSLFMPFICFFAILGIIIYYLQKNTRMIARLEGTQGQVEIREEIDPNLLDDKDLTRIKGNVEKWINAKKYNECDSSIEDMAAFTGIDPEDIKKYLSQVFNKKFIHWRSDLRIMEAVRILSEKPDISTVSLYTSVGFKDKNNFYKQFQNKTGMSFGEYKESINK